MTELARLAFIAALAVTVSSAAADLDPFEAFRQGRFEEARRGFESLRAKRPLDPALEINLASALYELGRYEDAARVLETAASRSSGSIRQQALYDLGNAAFRLERFDQAVQHYEEALQLDPDDADAAHNLELARQRLAVPPPPPPPPQGADETPPAPTAQSSPPPPHESPPNALPRGESSSEKGADGTTPPHPPLAMTREQAERLLSSLEDQPSPRAGSGQPRPQPRSGKAGSKKDW